MLICKWVSRGVDTAVVSDILYISAFAGECLANPKLPKKRRCLAQGNSSSAMHVAQDLEPKDLNSKSVALTSIFNFFDHLQLRNWFGCNEVNIYPNGNQKSISLRALRSSLGGTTWSKTGQRFFWKTSETLISRGF